MPGILPPVLAVALIIALLVLALLVLARRRRSKLPRSTPKLLPPPAPTSRASEPPRGVAEPLLGRATPTDADEVAHAPIEAPFVVIARPAGTRHPILLAHGWFGFGHIEVARLRHEYFRGIPHRLKALGHRVHVARVSPTGGIRVRAAQLARQIEQLGPGPVNIIAHSMGGLDARLAISHLGMGHQVASLTTIGTPHHGTPLADMATDFGEWRRLRRLLDALGANVDGLYDLSTQRMREFNEQTVDAPTVVYSSVIGAIGERGHAPNAMLSLGHQYLLGRAGPNDGLVPAWSQRWGDATLEIEADHWAQIGWSRGFDVLGLYAQLAERLADRGF